jgi:hypothetical protein
MTGEERRLGANFWKLTIFRQLTFEGSAFNR